MKNKKTFKRNFLLLILLSSFTFAHAQKESSIRILNDDYAALRMEITTGTPQEGKVTLCGETFSTLAIEGLQQLMDGYGTPALPILSRLIEVPLCEGFDVEVTDAVYDTLPALKHLLVPVQQPRRKSDTSAFKLFILNEAYSWNAFLGQREAMVEAVGIARDRRLARLQFSPVRYNPVTGQVIVCRHATLTVRYQGADKQATEEMFSRYHSPAFNSGAEVINNLYPKSVRTTAPIRYLIVANGMFRGQLDTFVQWKQSKGFLTDIVYTDDSFVGDDTTSIRNYIQSQYTNATTANPAPTYVLLVGDVAQLPPFESHLTSPSGNHVTDLYYMTWTSGDNIPDCHYGRFSAQNLTQLSPQIQKTLMYEQYTFPDPTFLDRAVMVAGVDAGNPGDNAYTYGDPAMDYAITNYVNGTHGWSQVMYFKNDVSIIPSCTTNVTLASSASGNAATVRSYYNQGAGFINYTAHGGSDGWGTPNFGNSHVNSMSNYQKFGLMIGNCCLTNKFEVSTCFGEALLRKGEYAGAVGYIGGSNSTYWGQDFYWAVGVRGSIGPSMSMAYNSSHLGVYDRVFHTHNEAYSNWCTTQGSMVMQGNMAVESSSSSTAFKRYYWEIYHLMGDPSVMPYMTQADTIDVSVSPMVTYGSTSLTVNAVPYAYVALTDTATSTLIDAAFADGSGNVTLSLPATLSVGSYLLAASAQQYRTVFRTVSIIQPAGAFPMVTAITSAPLNAGDTVELTLQVENLGNETAHNITIQLSSGNPQLTLSTATVTIDSLPAGSSMDLAAAVSAYVADDTPDNTFTLINTSSSWSGSTIDATSTLRLWLYAPVLSISFSNDYQTLLPGGTASLTATLHNSGHAPTRANIFSFTSPTPMLTVLYPTTPTVIASGSDLAATLTLQADLLLPQDIYVPLSYSFGSLSGSLPIFIGEEFVETFEGGTTHFPGWNAPAAYPWTVSTDQPFEGSYCLRSPQYTAANMKANMSINIDVTSDDSVSFYYRVSSEGNYDKFHFLIDSVSVMNNSGDVNWTRASFPLSAGSHILTFRYAKDYSVNSGSDCAWIDNLVLPHQAHNATFSHSDVCVGEPLVVNGQTINTQEAGSGVSVVASASGDVTVADYVIHPTYVTADFITACDTFFWEGTEYTASTRLVDSLLSAFGCDSIVGIDLTINHSTMGDTMVISTMSSTFEWYGVVYDTSGTYQQALVNAQGCDSIITLVLTIGNSGGGEGIDDTPHSSLLTQIYPNPTAGEVRFSTMVDEAVLYDVTGREVMRSSAANALDLTALPRGTYLLRLIQPAGTTVRRVVKQ